MTPAVTYSVSNGIATITLNRPDRLNALNDEMYHGILAAFDATDGDDSVRVIVTAIYDTGRMADAAEGVAAFLEKRPARWTLRPSADLPDWFPWAPESPFAP